MLDLPTGVVTFLMADIEDSTKRFDAHPGSAEAVIPRYKELMRSTLDRHNGFLYKPEGDAVQAVFASPDDAVAAAADAQHKFALGGWDEPVGPLKVRMGLHTGFSRPQDGDYVGRPLYRAHRLMSAAHGGQVLLSLVTAELVRDSLPSAMALRNLGTHQLKDLQRPELVFQLDILGLAAEFPRILTLNFRQNNLPAQLTPLVGRDREVDYLKRLLLDQTQRLIVFTGPSGIGKTRLALQVAADVSEHFDDGAYLVELASVRDPNLVGAAIAEKLGMRDDLLSRAASENQGLRSRSKHPFDDALIEQLRHRNLALILDSPERVRDGNKRLVSIVSTLLRNCPRITTMITSTEEINVKGRRHVPVSGLETLDPTSKHDVAQAAKCASVQLFVEVAERANPDFQLTSSNVSDVVLICHKLEGMPLAIELAAGTVKTSSLKWLLEAVNSSNYGQAPEDAERRQRTLGDAITWTYDPLSPAHQSLFKRLAVFAGGFTTESAASVCFEDKEPESLEVGKLVRDLVDKSLVKRVDQRDGQSRFRMLEPIRMFAREKLGDDGEAPLLQKRYAEYFTVLAEKAEVGLAGKDPRIWKVMLDDEHDNMRAVLQWARDYNKAEIGLRLAAPLAIRYWSRSGYVSEGHRWLDALLDVLLQAASPVPESVWAKALRGAAVLEFVRGDFNGAQAHCEESRALYAQLQDRQGEGWALILLANLARNQSDLHRAIDRSGEAMTAFRETNNELGLAAAANNLGAVYFDRGDLDKASQEFERARRLYLARGNKQDMMQTVSNIGILAETRGDLLGADLLYQQCLDVARELGDVSRCVSALINLGRLAWGQEDFESADTYLKEAEILSNQSGDLLGLAQSRLIAGDVARERKQYRVAEEAYNACMLTYEESGAQRLIAVASFHIGQLWVDEGHPGESLAKFAVSLKLFGEMEHKEEIADCLQGIAEAQYELGEHRDAAHLLGKAAVMRESVKLILLPTEQKRFDRIHIRLTQVLGEVEYEIRSESGRAMRDAEAISIAQDMARKYTTI